MHELPLVESLLRMSLERALQNGARRVLRVDLKVGQLCDAVPEWIERYFRAAAVNSIAEGASLRIEVEPATASCGACGALFQPPVPARTAVSCPLCGSRDCSLVAGLEWRLERIEVE
jgi:hydrogenase nickel incorporation protein HypA/HybF